MLDLRLGISALGAESALVELHCLEVSLQEDFAKELCRCIVAVTPALTGLALHHPFTRARVGEVPLRVVIFALHAYLVWIVYTFL